MISHNREMSQNTWVAQLEHMLKYFWGDILIKSKKIFTFVEIMNEICRWVSKLSTAVITTRTNSNSTCSLLIYFQIFHLVFYSVRWSCFLVSFLIFWSQLTSKIDYLTFRSQMCDIFILERLKQGYPIWKEKGKQRQSNKHEAKFVLSRKQNT